MELTKHPKVKEPYEELRFGHSFSDHMLEVEWTTEKGWEAPRIVPFHDLSLSPAASVLHYAIECFEGLKAYVDAKKHVRLFRCRKNMERMNRSCARVCLPTYLEEELEKCIIELIKVDRSWIPDRRGYSLYIRPTVISTDRHVGVSTPGSALLFVILSPVGPYYPTGFKPVNLLAEEHFVRAWPGGTGGCKLGSNYAPSILPAKLAGAKGCQQVLWLWGPEKYVSEVGTMNFMVFWKNAEGEKELVTAPLDDGTILPGVVRDSVLFLCRKWGEFKVSERRITMDELAMALEQNRVIEAFGTGTAAIIAPVKGIVYKDQEHHVPLDPADPKAGAGPLGRRLADAIMDIQYGIVESDWCPVIAE